MFYEYAHFYKHLVTFSHSGKYERLVQMLEICTVRCTAPLVTHVLSLRYWYARFTRVVRRAYSCRLEKRVARETVEYEDTDMFEMER